MLISNGWTSGNVPTPQVVVEAVMWSVQEIGLTALQQPDVRARLKYCDAAAKTQINQRIAALIEAGKIAGAAHAA